MDKALVMKVEGKFAFLNMRLNSSCKTCSAKGVCFTGDKPISLKVTNNCDLKVGDFVELELQSQTKLTAAFLLFILPLIFMVIGYAIGVQIVDKEPYGIAGGSVGLILSFILLKIINNSADKFKMFRAMNVKKIDKTDIL